MAYDKVKWHWEGTFPHDVPRENGATHIGLFVAWAIDRDLISDELREDAGEDLAAIRQRRITARDFVLRQLDGVLCEDDLDDRGNAFARQHYNDFLNEFARLMRARYPTAYHLPDDWSEYDLVTNLLDRLYRQWQSAANVPR